MTAHRLRVMQLVHSWQEFTTSLYAGKKLLLKISQDKLDMMEDGTNAKEILENKKLSFRMSVCTCHRVCDTAYLIVFDLFYKQL